MPDLLFNQPNELFYFFLSSMVVLFISRNSTGSFSSPRFFLHTVLSYGFISLIIFSILFDNSFRLFDSSVPEVVCSSTDSCSAFSYVFATLYFSFIYIIMYPEYCKCPTRIVSCCSQPRSYRFPTPIFMLISWSRVLFLLV